MSGLTWVHKSDDVQAFVERGRTDSDGYYWVIRVGGKCKSEGYGYTLAEARERCEARLSEIMPQHPHCKKGTAIGFRFCPNVNSEKTELGLFDFADEKTWVFDEYTVAMALSNLNRYQGHTRVPYSVAQHSWVCCELAEQTGVTLNATRSALIHDAHEAFIGDIVAPLKNYLNCHRLNELESRLYNWVHETLGVDNDPETKKAVEHIDRIVLAEEYRELIDTDAKKTATSISGQKIATKREHEVARELVRDAIKNRKHATQRLLVKFAIYCW